MKEFGIESWLREQKERQALLEELLHNYNEGRSMNLYCTVCSRMPAELIIKAINEAKGKLAGEKVYEYDMKSKARILKAVINYIALEANIKLK
jgi:hypothetical protein